MSTYREEMLAKAKKIDLKLYEAIKIVGTDPTYLPNMVKALQIFSWQNTPADNARLEAAKYYLKNRYKLNGKVA